MGNGAQGQFEGPELLAKRLQGPGKYCSASTSRMKVVPAEDAAGSAYRDQLRRQSGNNFAANAAKSSVASPDSSAALARSIPRMFARVPARAFTAAASARPLAAA